MKLYSILLCVVWCIVNSGMSYAMAPVYELGDQNDVSGPVIVDPIEKSVGKTGLESGFSVFQTPSVEVQEVIVHDGERTIEILQKEEREVATVDNSVDHEFQGAVLEALSSL